jgi:ribosomal protein S18 acetylase RimI-like enzyme
VTVRRFAPYEWSTYRALRLEALADSPDAFGSTYERESRRTDAEWEERLVEGSAAKGQMPIVAIVDETPIGLTWGRQDDEDASVGHLFQVWVSPEYRGRGVGRLLTDAVIEWARDLGLRSLRLGVTPSHPAALRLYRAAGFIEVGEAEPLRPGSTVFCQPMRLALDADGSRSPAREG